MNLVSLVKPYFFFLSIVYRSTKSLSFWRLIIAIVQAVNPLLILYTFKLIVDLVVNQEGMSQEDWQFKLTYILGGWGALTLLQLVLNHVQAYISAIQYQINLDQINGAIHAKADSLSYLDFENPTLRDTLYFVGSKLKKVTSEFLLDVEKFLQNGFTLMGVFWIIGDIHWLALPVFIITILPGFFIRFQSAQKTQKLEWRTIKSERKADYYSDLLIGKKHQKEVKVDSLYERVSKAFDGERKIIFEGKRAIHIALLKKGFFSNISEVIFMLTALVYLTSQTRINAISIGDLVLYVSALQKGQSVANATLRNMINSYKHWLPLQHFHKYMNLSGQPVMPWLKEINHIDTLEMKGVSFQYPTNEGETLKDINLKFKKGEIHAIVGRNGAGKSTLIKALCGLLPSMKGMYQMNGKSLENENLSAIWQNIGVVFQDFNCYRLPLYNNLTSLEPYEKIDQGRLSEIILELGLSDMIQSLPDGLETWLGNDLEKGIDLSGGQWQALALFRALYKDSDVLILDEPTSFMDGNRERNFLQFLQREKERKNKVIIIVSHRRSNVMIADYVHFVEYGVTKASGTHIELSETHEAYRDLFSSDQT